MINLKRNVIKVKYCIQLSNGRRLGGGAPCLLIAEVGINHNGDFDLACRSIREAALAGADAVKFQNYQTEDFVTDGELSLTYTSQGKEVTESQYDLFKRCEVPAEWLPKLAQVCRDEGVLFLSTPTSRQGVEELVACGVTMMKNGSDFLQNTLLLEAMAATGLPTMISTGMATEAEIRHSLNAYHAAGGKNPILLVCTSTYPTPEAEANLKRLLRMREVFDVATGFSDHTKGSDAAALSVALGGCVIEKHFTVDRNLPGPDHWFSSDPAEFKELVERVRAAEVLIGQGDIEPQASEINSRRDARLSCTSARDLEAGTLLTKEHIIFRRPGTGIPPTEVDFLIGKMLKTEMKKHTVIMPEYV
ncbi:MAG: N-acetylneuraminate synthase family protein [Candidatus Methylacidiphilales bacterium]